MDEYMFSDEEMEFMEKQESWLVRAEELLQQARSFLLYHPTYDTQEIIAAIDAWLAEGETE